MAKDSKPKSGRRVYKSELPAKISLSEGESYTGIFQGAKLVTITDRNTHEDKEVMQYLFRTEAGKKEVMLGAFQLDMCFEDLFNGEGGQERLMGVSVTITRGEDSKLPGKRTMGNYEISVGD